MKKFWTTQTVCGGGRGVEIVEMSSAQDDDSIEVVATGLSRDDASKIMDALQDAKTLSRVLRHIAASNDAQLVAACEGLLTHRQRMMMR